MGTAWSCWIIVLNHPSAGSTLLGVDFMTESLSKLIPWSGVCLEWIRNESKHSHDHRKGLRLKRYYSTLDSFQPSESNWSLCNGAATTLYDGSSHKPFKDIVHLRNKILREHTRIMTAFFVINANWPSADHWTVFREGWDVTVGMLRVVKMDSVDLSRWEILCILKHVENE